MARGVSGSKVSVWDLSSETELLSLEAGNITFRAVAFSVDGQSILTGDSAGVVKSWSMNGQLVRVFAGHSGEIVKLALSPDGKLLATASADQTVKYGI